MTAHHQKPIVPIEEMDFTGLERRERFGRNEAVCPSCKAWCCLDFYRSDKVVMRVLQHVYPCETYEKFINLAEKIKALKFYKFDK